MADVLTSSWKNSSLTSHFGRIRDIFYVLLIYCVMIFIFLSCFYAIDQLRHGKPLDDYEFSNSRFFIEEFVNFSLMTSIVLYFLIHRYRVNLSAIGLRSPLASNEILLPLMSGAGLYAVIFIESSIIAMLFGENPVTDTLALRVKNAIDFFDYATIFTVGGILYPIPNELFFRGFAYNILKFKYNISVAIVASSVFFAIMILNPWWFLQYFTLGIGLALLYEKSKSLTACMIAHVIFNLFDILKMIYT